MVHVPQAHPQAVVNKRESIIMELQKEVPRASQNQGRGQITIKIQNPSQGQTTMSRSLTTETNQLNYHPAHHSVVVPNSPASHGQVRIMSGGHQAVHQQVQHRQSHHMVREVVGQPMRYPGQINQPMGQHGVVRVSPGRVASPPHGISPAHRPAY